MRSPSSRHLRPRDLALLASDSSALDASPHVAECPRCRDAVNVVVEGIHLLRRPAGLAAPRPSTARSRFQRLSRASELGDALARAAQDGAGVASEVLKEHAADDALGPALIHACQRAARLAMRSAPRALALAELVEGATRGPGNLDLRAIVRAEARLLRSQAQLFLGRQDASLLWARVGRRLLERSEAPRTSVARARYFEASALLAGGATDEAVALLGRSRRDFEEEGLEHWVGRCDAATGLALYHRRTDPAALPYFEAAAQRLDPVEDGPSLASLLQNHAALLVDLGRPEEARALYSEALAVALKVGATGIALATRVNLLGLAIKEGRHDEVVARAPRVLEQAIESGQVNDVLFCRLFLAEAEAARGRASVVLELLEQVRASLPPALRSDPTLTEILATVSAQDAATVDHVRRLRFFLESAPDAGDLSARA